MDRIAIRYIVGRAGSGKTQQVLREIYQCLRADGEERLILLVPEQFTLQAERDLIKKLNLPGIMRVEVLSFTRLAQRVLNEVGGMTRTLLSEQGKNMVLRKMVDEVARSLTIYKKAAQHEGFVPQLSVLLSELKQQGIQPAELETSMEGETQHILGQKVHDIALVYEHFNCYLQGRYLDSEDYLNLLIDKIDQAQFLKNSRIWLDGFTTFAPQSLKIIEKLMRLARDLTISLTLDEDSGARDAEIFSLSRRSLQKIQAMAQRYNQPQTMVHLKDIDPAGRKDPALLHLERELYAYPGQSYSAPVPAIEVFAAANQNSELEYTAAHIVALVRERGWRWRDLAVVCNDMASYGSSIKRVFAEYGIPCFMDQKRNIMNHPLIKLILSSGEVIRRGYRYEDVFAFFKTGFSGLASHEIEQLENFVLRCGIQGQGWKQEFSLASEPALAELNRWREEFIRPMQKLEKKLAGKQTIAAFCRAHYEYLEEIGVLASLEAWTDKLAAQDRYEMVRENTQLWNIVLGIFDQLVEIMGDQEVSLKEYLRILEEGFAALEVGIIPTTIDQVLVGSIQRSKSHDILGLLVLGVNDGVLPSAQAEDSLLSETEKEQLLERGLDLDINRQPTEERFLIYSALCKPDKYLGLSYALADGDGKALRPSLLIDRLQRLFTSLQINSDVVEHRDQELHKIAAPASTFKYLIENLRLQMDGKFSPDFWPDVYRWYEGQEMWQERLSLVREGLVHRNQVGVMGTENARRLYALPLHSTVSRVEQFINCPFAHFVRYGLKPQERRIYEVGAPDIGELFHSCLLTFARQIQQENKNWKDLARTESDRIMDGIMDELVPEYGNGVFTSTHRYRYLVQRLKRISRRTIWTLTEHLQRGDFEPLLHEARFGPGGIFPAIEIELENGEKFYLEGRIDRVDLLPAEEGTFVKIIDYKSGAQDFSLSDVYYGLSLQLMIYLLAVLAGQEQLQQGYLKPGGVFYFKIDDPLINTQFRLAEMIERELAKKFKMKGLVLKDVELVRHLDHDIAASGSTDILPLALTASGSFSQKSSVLEGQDFLRLLRHVELLLRRIGGEIMRGQIKIEPVKQGHNIACTFCPYRAICQFDRLLADNNYRNIRPLDGDEVTARIKAQQEVAANAPVD